MLRKLSFVVAVAAMGCFLTTPAQASGGECGGGFCGTPNQSGGGGCGCGGGSILVNNTDEGDTYQYADDYDNDGFEDDYDNCPYVSNIAQADADGDGVGDICDSCANVANVQQIDTDGDGAGDKCDADMDNDGIPNNTDNCKLVPNSPLSGSVQLDTDGDGQGDACDADADNDGIPNIKDNCPLVANPDHLNTDPDTFGDACDNDTDGDGIEDSKDNCLAVANLDQADLDKDGIGDACDTDKDGDGVLNTRDNCVSKANPLQLNGDRDDLGDACDPKFCYVIRNGNKVAAESCLDPKAPFAVASPNMKATTNAALRLRLFANRRQHAINYQWRIVGRPSDSVASVENPRGIVNASSTFEYFYQKGKVARLTPDQPGDYKVELAANLVFADSVNPAWSQDAPKVVVTITAEGNGAGGCSVAGRTSAGSTAFILLGLLGLVVLRRRRRQ
jgi:MYXO-CTERM domain-containing protein